MMADAAGRTRTAAELSIRRAWITGVFHGLASAAILLLTGRNIVLAAQYPLASAAAIIALALFVRQRSRTAAFLLFVAVLTPATLKLFLGTVHVDVAAFVLAAVYGHGFIGTVRYRRWQAQGLAAVLAVVACSILPCTALAQDAAPGLPSLKLRPCTVPGVDEELRCATLTVYEDRAAATGRHIDLNIVILPARHTEPKPDPVFVLAGGPGQAATSLAAGLGNSRYRAERDVVLVDQRGTGASNPLACTLPGTDAEPQGYLAGIFGLTSAFEHCRDELETRADLRLYTTPLAMADLDDVRAALDYDRINLAGSSYGTRAALVYMRAYPARVRTAILNGVAPLALRNPLYHARDAQRAVDSVLDECAADADCRNAFPDLREEYRTLLARLEARPAAVRIRTPAGDSATVRLSRSAFAEALRVMMYDGARTRLVPLLIHRAHAGDLRAFAQVALDGNRNVRDVLAFGMLLSVVCAEDIARIDPAEIAALTAGTALGDGRVRQQMRVCDSWPAGDVPPDYADPVRVDVPVLLLSGTLDPVTPPEWAEEAARHLPRALHIVAPGAHGVAGPCINAIERQFLATGDPDRVDTRCVAAMTLGPFQLPED
jgi:pimeloyl-ACP methyl ester carboxylesterase